MKNLSNPTLFYDGACGLCHGAVKFVIKRDKEALFRFSALSSDYLKEVLSAEEIEALPDSMVAISKEGEILLRSDAVLFILKNLGGSWGVLATVCSYFPRALRDLAYNFIARIRDSLFATPKTVCPIMPEEVMGRFLP